MTNTQDREISITRLIDAPRERVWEAFTNPDHLIKWWGPDGFTNTFEEISITPGGVWKFIMHGPDGIDYPNVIVFKEIKKPERISYTHGSGDEHEPTFESVIALDEQNGKTLVTLTAIFETPEERERNVKEVGAIEGGKQTLGRLADYVSQM